MWYDDLRWYNEKLGPLNKFWRAPEPKPSIIGADYTHDEIRTTVEES